MKIISLVIAFLVLFTLNISAQESSVLERILKKGEIRVGMSGNQPPFSMDAKSGELIGYEVDLAIMLAAYMKVELKLVKMPFKKLLSGLESGKVDIVMSGISITPERNLTVQFASPYLITGKSILVKDFNLEALNSEEKLNRAEVTLVALDGSTSEEFVKSRLPNAKLTLAKDYDLAIQLLKSGSVKAMIADIEVCQVAILRNIGSNFTTLDEPFTIEPISMALPAGDQPMENFMSNYFTSLRMMGILTALDLKWFNDGSWLLEIE